MGPVPTRHRDTLGELRQYSDAQDQDKPLETQRDMRSLRFLKPMKHCMIQEHRNINPFGGNEHDWVKVVQGCAEDERRYPQLRKKSSNSCGQEFSPHIVLPPLVP
ncbi:hypothetical protein ANN_25942 [Periplaneta americana]|uniref:Uncharacterized protein n=1 Tax=Periplaneta americana TaxID=6978 RepID=A0ABQ8S508_PERAM|nr:hypothetical protein ANN_25942 [Periplaneta americana]